MKKTTRHQKRLFRQKVEKLHLFMSSKTLKARLLINYLQVEKRATKGRVAPPVEDETDQHQ